MGNHYVPQAYLRHFQIPDRPGFIWLFDKRGGEPHIASIDKITQSHNYYSPETEAALARDVEIPGNRAIERLLQGQQLNPSERINLSYYIGTMLMRGPRRRRRAREMYPRILAETISEIRTEITEMAPAKDSAWSDRHLAEVDAVERKFATDPPTKVVAQIREPWPYKSMVDAIGHMAWRVFKSPGPYYFITTDSPVFFSTDYGLARPESELCFPLSTTQAVYGCWQGEPYGLTFINAPQRLVKEVNRHLASQAERLAFCHEKAPWLPQILSKTHAVLSHIEW